MRVKVKGLGWLKNTLLRDGWVELSGDNEATVKTVLVHAYMNTPLVGQRLFKTDSLSDEIVVLLNGVDANLIGGSSARVTDGDEVVVLPVVHGG